MTGSAVERSGTKWTVLSWLPFKQGGWFGRGVIRKSEPTGGWADFEKGVQKGALFWHRFLHRFWDGFGVIFWI